MAHQYYTPSNNNTANINNNKQLLLNNYTEQQDHIDNSQQHNQGISSQTNKKEAKIKFARGTMIGSIYIYIDKYYIC